MPPAITPEIEYLDDLGEAHSLTNVKYVGGQGITISENDGHTHHVHGGGSYSTIDVTPVPPVWRERAYALEDSTGRQVGIFKGPVDDNVVENFTLYQPDQPECPMMPLTPKLLDPMDFDTQVAFETLPILEVWRYASGGVLLKFPE